MALFSQLSHFWSSAITFVGGVVYEIMYVSPRTRASLTIEKQKNEKLRKQNSELKKELEDVHLKFLCIASANNGIMKDTVMNVQTVTDHLKLMNEVINNPAAWAAMKDREIQNVDPFE